jgi:hypothetical protein
MEGRRPGQGMSEGVLAWAGGVFYKLKGEACIGHFGSYQSLLTLLLLNLFLKLTMFGCKGRFMAKEAYVCKLAGL